MIEIESVLTGRQSERFAHPPHVWVGFLWVLWFPLQPKGCTRGWLACLNRPSPSVAVRVSGPVIKGPLVQCWFLPWALSYRAALQSPLTLNCKELFENNDPTCPYLSFLNVHIHFYFNVECKKCFGSLFRSLEMFLWPEVCFGT